MRFRIKFSLATNIIIGMVLGILAGLFFGELCSSLGIIGDAFIQLMQMSVLPYIVVSLLLGIGGLSFKQAKMLATNGSILLIIFWAIAIVYVVLLPTAFPDWNTSSFFSESSVLMPPEVDYLSLYIPSNPFRALANSMVPAVVIFSIFVGIALIGIENKEPLLNNLKIISAALTRVTNWIVKLTPLGVFAISASAAGTMTIDEFGKMQVYIICYCLTIILIAIFTLPLLVTMLTPFRYRDILGLSKDFMLTALTTGNLFIVLPIISEKAKELIAKYELESEQTDAYADVIIPITFNFPNIAKLLCLFFILFGGWLTGNSISVSQYPNLIFSGLLSFFGSLNVAMPFMLNQMDLPADLFNIYMISGLINGKFSTMLASMNLFAFTLICVGSVVRYLKFSPRRIIMSMSGIVGISMIFILGMKILLANIVSESADLIRVVENMEVKYPVKTVVHKDLKRAYRFSFDWVKSKSNLLEIIKQRGVLRVGYNPNTKPFCFFTTKNGKEELVGFDVAMANDLAKELNCTLEFFPFEFSSLKTLIDKQVVDIAMSCVSINYDRIKCMNFTEPYMELTLAVVVKDNRGEEFRDTDHMKQMKNLTFAVLKGSSYMGKAKEHFPKADIIQIENPNDFFRGKVEADAFFTTAQEGSLWAIKYPLYTVVVPKPIISRSFIAYPVSRADFGFITYLNFWLKMEKANGEIKQKYDYWILGETQKKKEPRWCIMRNVLDIDWPREPEE